MNIKPLADRVLVEPSAAETKTASGIIIPDTAQEIAQTAFENDVRCAPTPAKKRPGRRPVSVERSVVPPIYRNPGCGCHRARPACGSYLASD